MDYSILEYGEGKIGEFQNANPHKFPIHEIEFQNKEKRSEFFDEFGFSVAINLSNIPLPLSHLEDMSIYEVSSPDYEIYDLKNINTGNIEEQTKELIQEKEKRTNTHFTHLIYLKTKTRFIQEFNITLVNKIPEWVNNTNTDCDDDIIGETNKTFGFGKLTNGVIEAYDRVNQSKNHFSIAIKVKS